MQLYTLGFLFSSDFKKVLLIHKEHPDWQKGKVNGLGGKMEGDETPLECIAREVAEESGLVTLENDWKLVGELHSSFFETYVLHTIYKGPLSDIKTLTDEKPAWFVCDKLPKNVMPNLRWLIPLCLEDKNRDQIKSLRVEYPF